MNAPNEGVNLGSIHIVQLLHSVFNLTLIRLQVHNEHKGIILLNLLHRALRVERVNDGPEGVHSRCMGNGFTRVLGITRESEGLGAVEGYARSDTTSSAPVCALQSSFFGGLGLGRRILLSANLSYRSFG